ncbi:MAG TPA: DNA-processing protein DprA [Candidatus Paceibacterota bacterium]|nr:DNA-processing protein DprA [Candidatus Paceibacterota bacterium]
MKDSIRKLNQNEFPKALLEIPQPPKQLYVEGELPDENEYIYLTVVGSRKFSNYGKDACEKLISELAGYNIVIVSGLAHGIDAIAHKAAMKAGLKTVGVPGSGLDRKVLYPSLNRKIADEIVSKGGALLSEFDPMQRATRYTFPQRNRIMAGLAKAILVIEAGDKSGTLITARLATEYNRDLLVVPGSIFSPNAAGSNKLINLGATPVSSGEEILKALGIDVETKQKALDLKDPALSENERKVLEILSIEPLPRDDLIRELKLPISESNTLLSVMEIKGLITESLGEVRMN